MPSHQERRDPLPKDYQYPTHGVDCDCVTCRYKQIKQEWHTVREQAVVTIAGELKPYATSFAEPTAETP